jgi:hypothetical protein
LTSTYSDGNQPACKESLFLMPFSAPEQLWGDDMNNFVKAIVIGGAAGLALAGCDGDQDAPTAEQTVVAPEATATAVMPVPMATDTAARDSTMTDGAMGGTASPTPGATESPAM